MPEDGGTRSLRSNRRLLWVLMGTAVAGTILILVFLAMAPTPIGDVIGSPRDYEGGVTVSGVVTGRVSILGRGGFGIEDRTGRIPVLTGRTPPPVGAKVRITGEAKEVLNDVVVLIER